MRSTVVAVAAVAAMGAEAAAVAAMGAEAAAVAAEGLTLAVAAMPWAVAAMPWAAALLLAVAAMLWPRARTSAVVSAAATLAGAPTPDGALQLLTTAPPGTPTEGAISRPRATASPMRAQVRTPRTLDMWRVRALSLARERYPRIRACTLA